VTGVTTRRILLAMAAATSACREPNVPAIDSTIAVSVDVSPASVQMSPGETRQFTATVRDLAGRVVANAPVQWSSTNPERVTVDATGLARAVNIVTDASARIVASVSRLADTAVVAVKWVQTETFSVWPDTNVMAVGMTRRLASRRILNPVPGSEGNYTFISTAAASWTSTNTGVATIDAEGIVRAVAAGRTTITGVLSDGRTSSAEVFVRPNTPLRLSSIFTAFGSTPSAQRYTSGCGLNTADGGMYCWGQFGSMWGETVLGGAYYRMSLPDSYVSLFDRCEIEIHFGAANHSWLDRTRCAETPVRFFADESFTALAGQVCGLSSAGAASCWGSNANGELGIGTVDASKHGPTQVATNERFQSLWASGSARCGIRADGVAFCWGGSFGSTPVRMAGDVSWKRMAKNGSCGIASDDTAYCWTGAAGPVAVGGGMKFVDVVAGNVPARCGLTAAGQVYCWRSPAFSAATIEPPILVAGAPALVHLSIDFITDQGWGSRICGLSAEGDMYCVTPSGSGDAMTFSLSQRPLGGLKLRQFFGECGIALDDKTYCWTVGANPTVRLLPGQ